MKRIKWEPDGPRQYVAEFREYGAGGQASYQATIRHCAGTGYELSIRYLFDEFTPPCSYPGYHEGHGATLERCKRVAKKWADDADMEAL